MKKLSKRLVNPKDSVNAFEVCNCICIHACDAMYNNEVYQRDYGSVYEAQRKWCHNNGI